MQCMYAPESMHDQLSTYGMRIVYICMFGSVVELPVACERRPLSSLVALSKAFGERSESDVSR